MAKKLITMQKMNKINVHQIISSLNNCLLLLNNYKYNIKISQSHKKKLKI
jgi:hypothetical protein